MILYAVASLLDISTDPELKKNWERLDTICTAAGLSVTKLPHFTWHVAEEYDMPAVIKILERMAGEIASFTITTSGLGLFTGLKPVLYCTMPKTEKMVVVHKELWDVLSVFSTNSSSFYQPDRWIPHVTVLEDDQRTFNFCSALAELAYTPLELKVKVDHLSVIFRDEEVSGIAKSCPFKAGS